MTRFLIRRGLKIYPGYYVLMAYYIGRDLAQGIHPSKQTLLGLVFLQNYGPGPVNYTWSLAVEEHFYLLLSLGLTLLIMRARSHSQGKAEIRESPDRLLHALAPLPVFIVIWCALTIAMRCLTALLLPYDNRTHLFPTHLRIDGLLFGVLIGYFYNFHHNRFQAAVESRRGLLALLACTLLAPAVWLDHTTSFAMITFGLTGLYVGYGLILTLVVFHPTRIRLNKDNPVRKVGALFLATLAFVGYYSYAIYLWHPPVGSGGMRAVERLTGVVPGYRAEFVLYLIGSIVVGVIMTKAVEAPVLRLRERFWPTRGSAA